MSVKRFCDMCHEEIAPKKEVTREDIDFYIIRAISSWDACKDCAFKIGDYIDDNFVKEKTTCTK